MRLVNVLGPVVLRRTRTNLANFHARDRQGEPAAGTIADLDPLADMQCPFVLHADALASRRDGETGTDLPLSRLRTSRSVPKASVGWAAVRSCMS
jgi:hypothetical protein